MSREDAPSVHSSSSRAHQSTSTASTSKGPVIDLTDDQDPPHSSPAVKADAFQSRLPRPQQPPAAPAPTAAGSVRVQSTVRRERSSTTTRKKERAWDEQPSQSSSSMSARNKSGQSFGPTDPELKKNRSSAGSSAYAPFATGDMAKGAAGSSRAGGKAPAPGQSRVFNSALTAAQGGGGAKKPALSRASASNSAQASSLSQLPRIPKTNERTANPRPNLLLEGRRDPQTDRHSPPPPLPQQAPSLHIKGKGKAPRASKAASDKGKGKAKAEPSGAIELSSDDEEEARGADGEDPILDADDGIPTSAQRNRRLSGVDYVKGAATAGDSSPDPLTLRPSRPFDLTSDSARHPHHHLPARPTGSGNVQNKVAHIEQKLGSEKQKPPKLKDRLQKRSSGPASAPVASTEKERNRRADGRGEEDNEYGSVSKPSNASSSTSKPRQSTASSSSQILDLPIELYTFAEHHAPAQHLYAAHRLVYNRNGNVGNHKIHFMRNNTTVAQFQRSDCIAMQMSSSPGDPPLVRFDFNEQSRCLDTIFGECNLRQRDVEDVPWQLVIAFKGQSLGDLDDGSDMKQVWKLLKQWEEEPNRIKITPWSLNAENTVRRNHRETLLRQVGKSSTQASSSRQVAVSPIGTRRVPKKAQQGKDGLQQTTLDNPAVRRSSRASNSMYAAPQPRPPTPEADRVPLEKLVLVYPIGESTGVVSITHGDTKRLQDGEFLNDTLIEFGLKRIIFNLRAKEEKAGLVDDAKRLSSSVHMFNSFFYKKFSQKGKKLGGPNGEKTEAHKAVKKWTTKFDLFKKQFVVVPINEHLHWYLAVIVNPGAVLNLIADPDAKKPPLTRTSARNQARQSSEVAAPQQADPAGSANIDEPASTSKFFPNGHTSATDDQAAVMDLEEARVEQEEQEEREQEERIFSQIKASAAQTEQGLDDSDSGGDVVMDDVTKRIEDVDMTDVGSTRANSPTPRDSRPLVAQEYASSSEDEVDQSAAVIRDLGAQDAPTSAQAPPAARPPSPSKPLARVPTPIEPSKFAPGDTAPPPQAQQPMTIDDHDQPSDGKLNVKHDKDRCQIHVFDSLDGKHPGVVRNLAYYLVAEAQDKLGISLSYESIMQMVGQKNVRVPLQDNFSDCGLYILHYVEQLLANPQEMLETIASIPDKVPRDQAPVVKELVNEKWNGVAAAGKRKVLRDEVNELCQAWAEYRVPFEEQEKRDKEEKQRKKAEAREAEAAREIARLAEQREQREMDEALEASRATAGDADAAEADPDSSMVVEEPEQHSAPRPMEEQEPSPAPSNTSNKKGKKGKGKVPRAPAKSKKKAMEVLTLDSDDDSDDGPGSAPPPRASTSNGASTSAHFQHPTAPSAKQVRGAESSHFIPPPPNLTTSPKHSPPSKHAALPPLQPPQPQPMPPTFASRPSGGFNDIDVDISGDLETPEPESQHRATAAGASTRPRSSPSHDLDASQGEDLPPRKKKPRHSSAQLQHQPQPTQGPSPNFFPVPFGDAALIAKAEVIARASVSPRNVAQASGQHIRFDDGGQRRSDAGDGDILVDPRLSSDDDDVVVPHGSNSPLHRRAPQVSPELGMPSPGQLPPSSSRPHQHNGGLASFSVVVPVSNRSASNASSSHQRRQQGPDPRQRLPQESSPVQIIDQGQAPPPLKREKMDRSAKKKEKDDDEIMFVE